MLHDIHMLNGRMFDDADGNSACTSNEGRSLVDYISHLVKKPTMWFLNRSDTYQAVQSQKQARSLKFRI